MSDTVLEGGCGCGAVRYTSTAAPAITGLCHCRDCQHDSGTGHAAHIALPADAVTITGELRFWDKPADSGNVVSRGFCPTCGSSVASRNAAMGGMIFIRAGSLDDVSAFAPQVVVYASRAPAWDHVDPNLPSFAEMPPSAAMPDGMD